MTAAGDTPTEAPPHGAGRETSSDGAARADALPGGAGLLTPFWIDEGMRVLAVGAGPEGLVEGLASRGAEVKVIEADPASARRLGRRSVGLRRVSVLQSTLSRLRSPSPSRPSYDALVHVPVAAADRDDRTRPRVAEIIAAASQLLRASGTLVLAVPNPWGLRHLLEDRRPGPGPGPLGIRAALDASGFREQRWLIAYPDPVSPLVIVDTRLFGSDEGVRVAEAFVRSPVRETPDATRLADPVTAFRAAAQAGLAVSIADWYVVVAMRPGAADASIIREGLLFIPPDPERQPAWADPRELERIGGRWLLHPTDSYASLTSGPFTLEPLTVAIPPGVSGEEVVIDALSKGLESAEARATLGAWWAAARAAIAGSEMDHRQLGILPRDFVVTPDGTWSFIAGDLGLRFPVPVEVLALRAIGWTLLDAVLPRSWVPGLAPATSVADAARAILGAIGVRVLDEHAYIWQELEIDLSVRTGRPGPGRGEHRERIRALTATPLGARHASLPVATLLAAGLSAPGLAAEASVLRARLAAVTAELEVSSRHDGLGQDGDDG